MTITQKLAKIRESSGYTIDPVDDGAVSWIQKQSIVAAFSEIVFRAGNDPKCVLSAMSEIRKELDL